MFLSQVDLINSHLPQRRSSSPLCPTSQIAQVHGSHRAGRQAKLPRHSSYRCALTGLPHRFFKALTERCLAREQGYFFGLDPARRTAHAIELDHYRGAVFRPRKISYLPLVDLGHLRDLPTTAGALQFAVPALATHPQAQGLGFLVDLAAIDSIPRPAQNLGPFALTHPAERTEKPATRKPPSINRLFRFLHRAKIGVRLRAGLSALTVIGAAPMQAFGFYRPSVRTLVHRCAKNIRPSPIVHSHCNNRSGLLSFGPKL